ncbi:MAG: PcsB-like coiled-coil domain-containing protein [Lachnospiraceae bacterium]|jgi:peptidoglycan hydrolase CwlO-like protein
MMKKKRITGLFLAMFMVILSALSCYGATTQDKIKDTKTEKQEAENSYHAAQDKILALESKKGELEAYLTELNQQLSELTANMEELQKQSQEKQEELEEIQADLEVAREQEAEQYESMKLRIQYMYENSNTAYIELFFNSENFMDFLNRAEQISQITDYDRNRLKEYEKIKNEIAEREAQAEKEQAEIEVLQEESRIKQEEIAELVQATYDQINTYAAEITEEESAASALLAQVRDQEANLNTLLKQAKDEEVAQSAAKKQTEATTVKKPEPKEPEEKKENVSDTTQETKGETEQSSSEGTYLGRFRLTGYCNCPLCCGSWSNGHTASGTVPAQGRTVAMGGVPFGTKLLINGNVYTVEDRGTAYGHVDIYFDSHASALGFGSQYAEVYQIN